MAELQKDMEDLAAIKNRVATIRGADTQQSSMDMEEGGRLGDLSPARSASVPPNSEDRDLLSELGMASAGGASPPRGALHGRRASISVGMGGGGQGPAMGRRGSVSVMPGFGRRMSVSASVPKGLVTGGGPVGRLHMAGPSARRQSVQMGLDQMAVALAMHDTTHDTMHDTMHDMMHDMMHDPSMGERLSPSVSPSFRKPTQGPIDAGSLRSVQDFVSRT